VKGSLVKSDGPTKRGEIMKTPIHLRLLITAAVIAVLSSIAWAPAASAGDNTGAAIVYSDAYRTLIAAAPSGWVSNECEGHRILAGGVGVCEASFNPVYFYPDGSFGRTPWFIDPSSPTGWSIEPDPCTGLTDDHYAAWATYVDYTNGYVATGPTLTDEQIDQYGACWGWWF
jgi:hypothetical protein